MHMGSSFLLLVWLLGLGSYPRTPSSYAHGAVPRPGSYRPRAVQPIADATSQPLGADAWTTDGSFLTRQRPYAVPSRRQASEQLFSAPLRVDELRELWSSIAGAPIQARGPSVPAAGPVAPAGAADLARSVDLPTTGPPAWPDVARTGNVDTVGAPGQEKPPEASTRGAGGTVGAPGPPWVLDVARWGNESAARVHDAATSRGNYSKDTYESALGAPDLAMNPDISKSSNLGSGGGLPGAPGSVSRTGNAVPDPAGDPDSRGGSEQTATGTNMQQIPLSWTDADVAGPPQSEGGLGVSKLGVVDAADTWGVPTTVPGTGALREGSRGVPWAAADPEAAVVGAPALAMGPEIARSANYGSAGASAAARGLPQEALGWSHGGHVVDTGVAMWSAAAPSLDSVLKADEGKPRVSSIGPASPPLRNPQETGSLVSGSPRQQSPSPIGSRQGASMLAWGGPQETSLPAPANPREISVPALGSLQGTRSPDSESPQETSSPVPERPRDTNTTASGSPQETRVPVSGSPLETRSGNGTDNGTALQPSGSGTRTGALLDGTMARDTTRPWWAGQAVQHVPQVTPGPAPAPGEAWTQHAVLRTGAVHTPGSLLGSRDASFGDTAAQAGSSSGDVSLHGDENMFAGNAVQTRGTVPAADVASLEQLAGLDEDQLAEVFHRGEADIPGDLPGSKGMCAHLLPPCQPIQLFNENLFGAVLDWHFGEEPLDL